VAAVAGALDFAALVERENARFVGRLWVLEEIDRWARDSAGDPRDPRSAGLGQDRA
jgi:hypothetical protein